MSRPFKILCEKSSSSKGLVCAKMILAVREALKIIGLKKKDFSKILRSLDFFGYQRTSSLNASHCRVSRQKVTPELFNDFNKDVF